MTYDVLVYSNPDGHYRATVRGWPDCTVEGYSRRQVIQRVRQAIVAMLSEAELVQIEIEPSRPKAALAQFAGMWAEDDTFDEFVATMETHRHGLNRDEHQL